MRIGNLYPPRIIARAASLSAANLRQWSTGFGTLAAPLTFLGEHGPNGRRRYSYADAVLVTLAARLCGSDGTNLGFTTVNDAVLIANALAPSVADLDRRYAPFADPLGEMAKACPVAVVRPANQPAQKFAAELFGQRADYLAAPPDGLVTLTFDMFSAWQLALIAVTRAAEAASHEDDAE
jgi:hypothetical protein